MDVKINRKVLVDALRSGEYNQTTILRRDFDDGTIAYCPLGVACELFRQIYQGNYVYEWKMSNVPPAMYFCAFERSPRKKLMATTLIRPFGVVNDFFGFSDVELKDIIKFNDAEKLSFDAIAEWIETERSRLNECGHC